MAMALWTAGCGGDDDGSTADPTAACEQAVEVVCAKVFECTTEAERMALGLTTEAACISDGKDEAGCEELTLKNVCDGNETYDPGAANDCLDQLDSLECGQARDGIDDEDAPACADTCAVE